MFLQKTMRSTVQLGIAGVFTALVAVATISLKIDIPSTKGFFNLGEIMVYAAALLFGPFVGLFAGGIGSMLGDVFLGYYLYAPATLAIKGLEGGLVGFLASKKPYLSRFHTRNEWKGFSLLVGVLIGALVSLIGFLYYSGVIEFRGGLPPPESPTSTIFVPVQFWLGLGAFVAVLVGAIAFLSEPEYGWMIVSTVFGGLLMVSGYFLYEQLVLGVLAIAEVPINIGQMTIGLIVATPIVKIIQRTLPQLKNRMKY